MKKVFFLITICLFLFVLGGCQNESTPQPDTEAPDVSDTETPDTPENTEFTVGDYFPITDNTRYVYQGEGNEYAAYDVYNDYSAANKVQQRIDNGGTVMANVVAIAEGKLIKTFSSGETYYRENALDATGEEEILLMEPLVTGTTWTLADGSTRTITNTSLALSTPAGDYDALEVTTERTDSTTIQYYAKDVGLVKTIFLAGEAEISSTLSAVEEDVPSMQTLRFFYPNINDDTIYYVDREIAFYTNDVTKDSIAAAYQEVPSEVGSVFSANTAINDLSLGSDGMVYLDLNQAFLTEMNAGSAYEGMILQCIADTFGYYYNADKVILTVEGATYESGHFAFTAGEYLEAAFTDTVPLP